jgi:outer membrane receptor protein involved in Fe transport
MREERRSNQEVATIYPNRLSLAIASILAAPAGSVMAQDQDAADKNLMLEEVLVTARKRAESMQDIPESIQAISQQQLVESALYSLDDYVRFIPSLSYVQSTPGVAKLVFRGIADDAGTFIAEASAALYLDEQSLTLNATPDPRMVDIERVEALSGPQGTLYGASAQSGLLRIITNKPDPTAFDAWVDITGKYMEEGDPSYDVSAMVNLPISDTFALRLVGFSAKDGGFIDNVLGDTPAYGLYTNEDVVEDDFNETTYIGGRISARWFISDDWTATAGIVYQNTESEGKYQHDPDYAGDLNVVRFRPDKEWSHQDWSQYSLTIEGDLGFADFVSATSYFERDWDYRQDTSVGYTSYFGQFCYAGYYNSPYCWMQNGVSAYYNEAIGYLGNNQHNSKFAQEFRLVHSGDKFDWVAGVFYEKSKENWDFFTKTEGYNTSRAMADYYAGNISENIPTRAPEDTWWFSADDTTWTQWAVFGEVTWHITDKWDFTAGYRYFDRDMDKQYYVELPKYNLTPAGVSIAPGSDTDGVPKFSLAYQINDNSMVYALYSEGFRPGGTNRNRGNPFLPTLYDADKLNNYELGWKNTLMDGRMRLNLTYFSMEWEDYQLEVVDPSNQACGSEGAPPEPNCSQPWQKVVSNAGNATSNGLEVQWDFNINENWSLGANATWLDATLDQDVQVTVLVPKGSRLPLSPEFKASAYAQYEWGVSWGAIDRSSLRLQWSYTDDMLNTIEPVPDSATPQILQPSYNIGDLTWAMFSPNWDLQVFVKNITDERAMLFADTAEFDYFYGRSRVTVNRPREFGVRWIYRFK